MEIRSTFSLSPLVFAGEFLCFLSCCFVCWIIVQSSFLYSCGTGFWYFVCWIIVQSCLFCILVARACKLILLFCALCHIQVKKESTSGALVADQLFSPSVFFCILQSRTCKHWCLDDMIVVCHGLVNMYKNCVLQQHFIHNLIFSPSRVSFSPSHVRD